MTPDISQQQQINNDDIILDRINAMRLQEDDTSSTIQIKNYFTAEVNEACRKAMVDWCFTVVDMHSILVENQLQYQCHYWIDISVQTMASHVMY